MNMRSTLLTLLTLAGGALFSGCSEQKTILVEYETSSLPESFYLATAPASAVEVVALREGLEPGAEVVVRGKVGDYSEGFATLTLVDLSMKSCDVREGDGCPTPWDYCCEDPTTLAERSVQVEFREGADPLATSVQGFHELDRLSVVTVSGRFQPDEQGNLLVVADGIHVGS